jgi:hypothetical protein
MKTFQRSIFSIFLLIAIPATGQTPGLFDSDEVLTIQISGSVRELFKDRQDESPYRPFKITDTTSDSNRISIPIQIKTRGHFRKSSENCTYPPLMLNFSKSNTSNNSIFASQDKLKLVTPCREEKYVVREYLVYKLYNLVSPKSFKARLVKVIYVDTVKGKKMEPLFGILLEEENKMAARNQTKIIEGKMVRPERTQADDFHIMAVFQYLIGNTDWSVQYYQNIKLIASGADEIPSPVPYDFDHAGIVDAPYALPEQALMLSSTRERRYRGYCLTDLSSLDKIFLLFNNLKNQIYEIYNASTLLEPSYKKITIKFLDEFYKTINDSKAIKNAFGYPCQKDGTSNVVIKGLKKN